ncbi:MAG: hypothetical protein M0035_07830 [Actinomycetota bacterium]|nr:hypothetical protein [Actinomycetota bacterium]
MQQTITVPPSVNAKTAQRHDYPSKTWRASYARRSAAGLAPASTCAASQLALGIPGERRAGIGQ